eukprot:4113991-Amphidinium_carterae.2
MKGMSFDALQELQQSGCKMYTVHQKALDAVIIPTGFLCVEQSLAGVLVYGMRSSTLVMSEDAVNNYETFIGLQAKSGKNVDNNRKAIAIMTPEPA